MLKPKAIAIASEEEINNLNVREGTFTWDFPVEVFDGKWYRMDFANPKDAKSAQQSYRAQSAKRHKRRAQVYMKANSIYVRLTDLEPGSGQATGRIKMNGAGNGGS